MTPTELHADGLSCTLSGRQLFTQAITSAQALLNGFQMHFTITDDVQIRARLTLTMFAFGVMRQKKIVTPDKSRKTGNVGIRNRRAEVRFNVFMCNQGYLLTSGA